MLFLPRSFSRVVVRYSFSCHRQTRFLQRPQFFKSKPTILSQMTTKRTIVLLSGNDQEYKLNLSTPLDEIKNGQKLEVEVEGVQDGRVLLLKVNDSLKALGTKCTHYGAPMIKGVVTGDGRITCPWHGACFSTESGDIENAPALDHIESFPVHIKNNAVYIIGTEARIKAGKRKPNIKCRPQNVTEHVVVVGGGSGAIGAIESLREKGFNGLITCISKENYLPIDRTKLSKALLTDLTKLQWRDASHFEESGVKFRLGTTVTEVDFATKTIATSDGDEVKYKKIILATGGTPRWLPLEGLKGDLGNVFVLRGVGHAKEINAAVGEKKDKKIVVIGSSFIGMEVGNCLASQGNDVTIVGMESAPMERIMGAPLGQIFQRLVASKGVKFRMSANVEKGEPSSSEPSKIGAVILKSGERIPADVVILGVGVAPETSYIKEEQVKKQKDGSLKVDDCFRIEGVEDAYAVGDIATYPYTGPGTDQPGGSPVRIEHWNVAQNSGRQVGAHIAAGEKPVSFTPVFWSALGQQLRYCGNTQHGYDDLFITDEPENSKFVAYFCKGEDVVAVASMQKDPYMTQAAELMRRGVMPKKSDLKGGIDILQVEVPAGVKV